MNNDQVRIGLSKKNGQLGFMFTRGGPREGAGRKGIGITKKISLTLTEEIWEEIDRECEELEITRSAYLRNMIESYYATKRKDG
ncbi:MULTISPECIES: ribbon-helix-helix domain-containing protein [Paenibacillus]|uniref:ribbon-helix-helix domain-containing protein n=1 Tax=Paenibacillus TaxID=44249 RepID=UPI0021B1F83F|nr:ribbon-helix-helix domain-containing protein [Paenibacillus sp. IHBB 10380]